MGYWKRIEVLAIISLVVVLALAAWQAMGG